jgi:predicted transcriptional regulator
MSLERLNNYDMDGFKDFIVSSEAALARSDSDILHLYQSQKKVEEIALETGRSVGDIYRTLQKYNIEPNRLRSNHGNVKYYHGAGYSIPQIANLTGYTERNIRYILRKLSD